MLKSTPETKEQELARLRETHADVFNNPAVQAIANWRDPLDYLNQSQTTTSDKKYSARAKEALPILMNIMERTESRNVSDSYKR
jgi:hypothetical protein